MADQQGAGGRAPGGKCSWIPPATCFISRDQMRPQYLEAYLKRDPPTVDKYQLLWQFYVKDGQPIKAAEVLCALAESVECVNLPGRMHIWSDLTSSSFQLPLTRRLEYLTLAVGNAKGPPGFCRWSIRVGHRFPYGPGRKSSKWLRYS